MTEALAWIIAAVGAVLLVVSAVWLFGPLGMAGAGLVLLAFALFVPTRKGKP